MPYTCTLGNSKKFSMMTNYFSFMQQLIHEVILNKLSMIKCYFLVWMMNQYLNIEPTSITSMVNTTYHLLRVHVINYERTQQPMTLNTKPIDTCRETQHMLIFAKKITMVCGYMTTNKLNYQNIGMWTQWHKEKKGLTLCFLPTSTTKKRLVHCNHPLQLGHCDSWQENG